MRWIVSAALSTAICTAPSTAQTPPLPAGWTRPTDADLQGPNWEFRKDRPDRYTHADGDFNGDGKKDRAELLINQQADQSGLFILLAGQSEVIELDRSPLKEIRSTGVSTSNPGRYKTLCGKGYEAADPHCEKGAAFVDVAHPSIQLFAFESASSQVYWTGKAFERFWTSD